MSIATFKKPAHYLALPDWYASTWEMRQTGETRITDSYNLRAEARQLRNETEIQTNWDTHHNNIRLEDRVKEITSLRNTLIECLGAVREEIELLSLDKHKMERDLEALGMQLSTISECLRERDCRQGDDLLLLDEADAELKNELGVVEALKTAMIEKWHTTWQELNKLREAEHHLETDIGNKLGGLEIDAKCLELTKDSINEISFKPNPLGVPKRSLELQNWIELSRFNKLKADNEIEISAKLREALYCIRERTKNDILAQKMATDYALRHRIFETERQYFEINWQRHKMQDEMDKLALEIDALEKALLEKTNSCKLAQTRLENRRLRKGTELVQDEAQIGLANEVMQLYKTREDLIKKIDDAKATYNALERYMVRCDRDVSNKQNAITADRRCLEIRNQIGVSAAAPMSQMARNIQLTKTEENV